MPHSPHSGRVAALSRFRDIDDPDLVAARRDLVAEQIEAQVRRAVVGPASLLPEQRARIVALLDGGPIR